MDIMRKPSLFIAIETNQVDMVKVLLKYEADVYENVGTTIHEGFEFKLNPMTLIAMNDDVVMLDLVMAKALESLDLLSYIQTMRVAKLSGSRRVLSIMGSNPKIGKVLEIAIAYHSCDTVEMMLGCGCNANTIISSGQSVLELAVDVRLYRYGDHTYQHDPNHDRVIQLLLEHGADPNVRILDSFGYMTLLRSLICYDEVHLINMFIKAGADIHTVTYEDEHDEHQSAIELACLLRRLDVVKILQIHGVDVHAIMESGYTALACAVKGDAHSVVAYLIEQGADYSFSLRLAHEMKHASFVLYGHQSDYTASNVVEQIQTSVLERIRKSQAARILTSAMRTFANRRIKERRHRNMMRALALRGSTVFQPRCSGYNESIMGKLADCLESLKWKWSKVIAGMPRLNLHS